MSKYVIGLDFGTSSGRAVVVSVENGEILSSNIMAYPHGILDSYLPDNKTKLGVDWCLQHPQDYIDVMCTTITGAVKDSCVAREDIIGLSIDCTSCTVLPLDENARPLCQVPGFEDRPHAYVKLWKHHAAQRQADEINEKMAKVPNNLGYHFGNRISSEIMLPKAMQILREDPEVYQRMAVFVELPDWLNYLLTGNKKISVNTASYKGVCIDNGGYSLRDFLKFLDPELENFIEEKQWRAICKIDEPFGKLLPEWADRLGLRPGIAVGCGIIDAHACLLGCGITEPGKMMLVLGTSSVQSTLCEKPFSGSGIVGTAKDSTVPGYYAYETGLAAVGDLFAWYASTCTGMQPYASSEESAIHLEQLTEKAAQVVPGASGLLALDWWNGNKTPFVNGALSGVLVGMRLNTASAEIFRALMESTAFGTRRIIDHFLKAGARVDEIIACGGIAEKNSILMQIFSDVLGRKIRVADCSQTGALGAAMIASVAAGADAGGYATLSEAAAHMTHLKPQAYHPNPVNARIYDALYERYLELSEYFGAHKPSIVESLRGIP